jgi:hypothetical protein
VRDRVRAAYGIEATVLPPPVALDATGDHEPVPALADWVEPGYHLVEETLFQIEHGMFA